MSVTIYEPETGTLGLVYLAGPMRGIPEFNFPAFFDAAERLVDQGWGVFNPAAMDTSVGFVPTDMTGDEDLAELGFSLRGALGKDLEFITSKADAVAVLPGWENSKGAQAEVATARALGLPVFRASDGRYVPADRHAPTGEVRVTSSTGGQKGDKEARFDLIPPGPLWELAVLYGRGNVKYPAERGEQANWQRGYHWSLSYAALRRHLELWWMGEDIDEEMGVKHLVNAAWHALNLAWFVEHRPEFDDRPAAGYKGAEPTPAWIKETR